LRLPQVLDLPVDQFGAWITKALWPMIVGDDPNIITSAQKSFLQLAVMEQSNDEKHPKPGDTPSPLSPMDPVSPLDAESPARPTDHPPIAQHLNADQTTQPNPDPRQLPNLQISYFDAPEVVPYSASPASPTSPKSTWSNPSQKSAAHLFSQSPYPEVVSTHHDKAHMVYDTSPEALSPTSDLYTRYDPDQSGLIYVPQTEEKIVAPSETPAKKRRVCGLSLPVCAALLIALLVILGIALGVGLGVGLHNKFVLITTRDSTLTI
jgi:hypothetical protein